MSGKERNITIFPEPAPEDKSKYYDKAKLNEFKDSLQKHEIMFNILLDQKRGKAIEIKENIDKATPENAITFNLFFRKDQKKKNANNQIQKLSDQYEELRKKPITDYDENFFENFKEFDDEVQRFLESHNIKSLRDKAFSEQLAHFFKDEFLKDLNINYDSSPFFHLMQRFISISNPVSSDRIGDEKYVGNYYIDLPSRIIGGKRRRSTKRKTKRSKRKTKRSKRKQKRNTKRRAYNFSIYSFL